MREQAVVARARCRRADVATGSTSTSATSRRASSTRTSSTSGSRRSRRRRPRSCASSPSTADQRRREGTRWSFCRDFGRTRVIFIDSRAGRVLEEGRRAIVDDEEWDWIAEHARGDFDHLLIGTSVPFLLSPGLHHLEAVERGGLRRRLGTAGRAARREAAPRTRLRPLGRLPALLPSCSRSCSSESAAASAASRRPRSSSSPATSTTPTSPRSRFPRGSGVQSAVYQARLLALPQPARQPRAAHDRGSRSARPGTRARPRRSRAPAGAPDPGIRWRFREGPYFDNQVATLTLDGRERDDAAREDGGRTPRATSAASSASIDRHLTDGLRALAGLALGGPAGARPLLTACLS